MPDRYKFNFIMLYRLIPVFLLFFIQPTSWAQDQLSLGVNDHSIRPQQITSFETLKAIPVLENGRVKPLDTYANNLLLQFSGKRRFRKKDAIEWLAKLVFDPKQAREDQIFLIDNPSIPEALRLEVQPKRRYSFAALEPVFDRLSELAQAAEKIDRKQRDIAENEIIRVYENLKLYSLLSLSFSFIFPHPDFTITDPQTLQALNLDPKINQYSYLDIAVRADALQRLTQPLEQISPQVWTQAQKEIVSVIDNLMRWSATYKDLPMAIVPLYSSQDQNWISPWDAMPMALQTPEGRKELDHLYNIILAYWNGQQLDFDIHTKAYTQSVRERLKRKNNFTRNLTTELLFNRVQLFMWVKIVYLVVIFIFLISLIKPWICLRKCAFSMIGGACLLHALAIIMRILILQRPPVSNLYETFIFVSLICVITGLIIEIANKQWLGIVTASVCGYVFLTLAGKFSMEGDTLQMLVAVLNSNFWLGTHVLSITTGYAGICVAGIVGHIYILQAIFKTRDKALLTSTYRVLLGTLGFGLTMTFLGTNLGGIWADQSWGRFWGWDPKENGALLIILWTALLFHCKVGKIITPLGLAVGSSLGIIVVMWAWFGVNLLSIGLHSYGFTSGLATNLAGYFIFQIFFVVVATPIAKRRLNSVYTASTQDRELRKVV